MFAQWEVSVREGAFPRRAAENAEISAEKTALGDLTNGFAAEDVRQTAGGIGHNYHVAV